MGVELDDVGYVGKVVGDALFVETCGQRGEGVAYPLVVSTCGEEGDVKLGVGGDNSGAEALASLGENVHQVALHTVRGGSSNVDAVASARIEFRCLARCKALEDGSLAAEGQEVLEGERAVGVQDGGGRASVERGMRKKIHSLSVQAGAEAAEGRPQAAHVQIVAHHVYESQATAVFCEAVLVLTFWNAL